MKNSTAAHDSAPSAAPLLADFLTPDQLADELEITRRTLERWHAQRIGPPRTLIGRRPYYNRQAVRQWLIGQEQPQPVRGSREQRHRGGVR